MAISFGVGNVGTWPRSRTANADLEHKAKLSAAWPEVAPRVQARLRKLGATPEQAEDLAQDVAERIAAKQVPFVDAVDLTRFAHHVARFLWIDLQRSNGRRGTMPSLDVDAIERDYAEDVVESLTARRAWQLLRPADRMALLVTEGMPKTQQLYDATYHARKRLLAILATLQTWLAWIIGRVRKVRSAPEVTTAALVTIAVWIAVSSSPESANQSPPASRVLPSAEPIAATPTTMALGRARKPDELRSATPPEPPYPERISLPTGRIVLGPGEEGFVNAGMEPTTDEDAVFCLNGDGIIKARCIGDASDPLALLAP